MDAGRVACVAVVSRLVALLLYALFDSLIADYDTSSRLRTLTCKGSEFGQGRSHPSLQLRSARPP